ncbi:uncharacterized protein MONOS_6153 [Monocercomonoides exilis]|uniref:uncharacterized protein n=1 Tax=Monocercomonoides exilis TaxID=2049356 RepID=UPI00355AA20E|nr:hypothetical protein MONOS_6153 [Monocercomonoides exilis]|eukprot:MONOS_6153.1-p1 / transcript=MONOS_6153.1 / gene=MONOS_6153 / organism=Monocercomonoides_exilis_PA203 / gene_product=unspecified product / transcript_product=unspecified product / location=Mono_scaffold00190:26684-27110(+) / protein_length=117 / sequence_SO=supercontig / SO=protein_coding / is_pseudo=false
MEDATKVDFRSKLSAEQRKGNQWEKPKAKTKMNEKNEISTLKAYTFDSRLAQATTERSSRDRRRLHTQSGVASSIVATPPLSRLHHIQSSASSFLVGTPPKPLTPSSPTTDSLSLA